MSTGAKGIRPERGQPALLVRALTLGITLTLLIFVAESWVGWSTYAAARSLATTELRLRHLAGTIMHLDEVLTMSARMAAATGDRRWEERYRMHEGPLDAAIKESLSLAPEARSGVWASKTADANDRLLEMESRAFHLVRAGSIEAAAAILESTDYDNEKRAYEEGMRQTVGAIESRSAEHLHRLELRAVVALVCSLVLLAALAACWAKIIVLIRRDLAARGAAEAELQLANETLEYRVLERTVDLCVCNDKLEESLAELRATQEQLIGASRRAGMADVATSVLHNVGNVLNSLNVSATIVANIVRASKGQSLGRAATLLAAQPDRAQFLTSDRGQKLVDYFGELAKVLDAERDQLMGELESLTRNVEHIKVIVMTQQSHAKVAGVVERVLVSSLIDDALALCSASTERHHIEVVREYSDLDAVETDRHKLFQILVNLICNARQALRGGGITRRLVVRTRSVARDRFAIEVEDNGVGIAAPNIDKIFGHGFTTKPDGHGFGLHASGCAAIELGGGLSARSDGEGHGATFVIDLPLNRRRSMYPSAA